MSVVASTVMGILGLIDSLGISETYPKKEWVNAELIPALKTVAERLGNVEQSLHANTTRDWTLWMVVVVFGIVTLASAFLTYKQMARTKARVETVSRGVVSVGTKLNVQGEHPFPEMRF